MKACPVCGGPVRSVALTPLEEQEQVYPHVSAAWRCAAWPACDTRRVVSGRAVPVRDSLVASLVPESRPRDSDIGGPAWGTKK
jgi:hypothetical protein